MQQHKKRWKETNKIWLKICEQMSANDSAFGNKWKQIQISNYPHPKFCQENNIDLHIISSYHHISNGLAEREIWTVETMIRTSMVDQADWSRHLPGLVWAYTHTTGVTSFSFIFGREAEIPFGISFHLDREFGLPLSWTWNQIWTKLSTNPKKRPHLYDRYTRKSHLELACKKVKGSFCM